MTDASRFRLIAQLMPCVAVGGWLWLSYLVLNAFFITLLWAFILAHLLYPLYRRCLVWAKGRENVGAASVTVCVAFFLFMVALSLFSLLQDELERAFPLLLNSLNQLSYELPQTIRAIPHVGKWLQKMLAYLQNDRNELNVQLLEWSKVLLGQGAHLVGRLGEDGLHFSFVLTTLFFCLRDGEKWLVHIKRACHYYLGDEKGDYLQVMGDTSRAVVYGLVLAALGQGTVAGIGYALAGVEMPILLGALTALLALVPMGAVLVWLPTALMLIVREEFLSGVGLVIWGFLAVSTVDNVIRPLVICNTSQVPFLVVLFGVFGGLKAFGAIGLFLGPVILSVLLAMWRQSLKNIPH